MNGFKKLVVWIVAILMLIVCAYYIGNIIDSNKVRVNNEVYPTILYLFYLFSPSIIIAFLIVLYGSRKIGYFTAINFVFYADLLALILMIIGPFCILSLAESHSSSLYLRTLMNLFFVFAIPSTYLSYLFLNLFIIIGKKFFIFQKESIANIKLYESLILAISLIFLIAFPFLQFYFFNNQVLIKFIFS